MRMELPQCDLKTCRYYSDGNCLNKTMYAECKYTWSKNCLVIARELIEEYSTKVVQSHYYDLARHRALGAVEALEELFIRFDG